VYGSRLPKIAELERKLIDSPAEQEVRAYFGERARTTRSACSDVAAALARERSALERIRALRAEGADCGS
jgi:cation/acetate symporter